VRNEKGEIIAMNRNGILAIVDDKGREKERYPVVYGARITVADGDPVKANQILLEWDPYTFSILTEVTGVVHFKDLQEGITLPSRWTKSPACRSSWSPIRPTRSGSRWCRCGRKGRAAPLASTSCRPTPT
jgi:hypothetical protein